MMSFKEQAEREMRIAPCWRERAAATRICGAIVIGLCSTPAH